MPDFLIAGGAALLSGSMLLVVGALVSWFVRVPPSVTAGIRPSDPGYC
jgi:ZIP family zinc transporter